MRGRTCWAPNGYSRGPQQRSRALGCVDGHIGGMQKKFHRLASVPCHQPGRCGSTLIIWVGLLALFRGITEIVLAFELKSAQQR